MQPINMIITYHWDKKLKKSVCPGSWYNTNFLKKHIDLMYLAERLHFLQDLF